jgi:hypothetical protein
MSRWKRGLRREHPGVTTRRNRATMQALISDPEQRARFEADFPESALPALPKKRGPIGQSGKLLERDVQKAILELLAVHPRVVFAGRFNRGSYADAERYVRFNTVRGFPDIHGLLKGGRALYIEVKRDAKSPISSDQADFLETAANGGALAIVAYSVEQVHAALV